ncbi:MAG: type II toxin-antitoxin system PemK/MazF family toxin [Thiobacillaceae bacterium]
MTYEAFDVVVVPFPFADRNSTKRRPALVLSGLTAFNSASRHSVLAMITSAKNSSWPLDIEIIDLDAVGLPSPSMIRMKLFTLDHQLILRKLGRLGERDRAAAARTLKALFQC